MSSSSQVIESWISSFCSMLGHEYFAEVSEDFIEDDFNLTGLSSQVPMYKEALELILDVEPDEEDSEDEDDEDSQDEASDDIDLALADGDIMEAKAIRAAQRRADRRALRLQNDLSVIESSAELLYGLIHQRYITSRPGIGQMHEKYELGHFGACPRVLCHGARVLPVGCSDTPGQDTVKLFCPSCLDVYTPPNSRFQTVDGAFFGTTFGCLFLMTFTELQVGPRLRPVAEAVKMKELSPTPVPGEEDSPAYAMRNGATSQSSHSAGIQSSSSVQTGGQPNINEALHPSMQNPVLPPQPSEINGVTVSNFAPGLGSVHTANSHTSNMSSTISIYEPKIYGFRVAELSRSGPRMRWLRMKPADLNELDETGRYWLAVERGIDVEDLSMNGRAGEEDGMVGDVEDEDEADDDEIEDLDEEMQGTQDEVGNDQDKASGSIDMDFGAGVSVRQENEPPTINGGAKSPVNETVRVTGESAPGRERRKSSLGRRRGDSNTDGVPTSTTGPAASAMSMDVG